MTVFYFSSVTISEFLTIFLFATDKRQVSPRLSLTNVAALNYLLRSEIFVSEDGQLRSAPLILGYTGNPKGFQPVGNAIVQGDYRLARIDVGRKGFLAPDDLEPVPRPIPQVAPPLIQPLQQVPLGQGIEGEGAGSSTSSLEDQIDDFQFEGEASRVNQVVEISDAEEEAYEQSGVHLNLLTTHSEDSSDDDMDLRSLMKGRGKKPEPKDAGTSKIVVTLPPVSTQVPDPSLKPIPDLMKKRPHVEVGEKQVLPNKGAKQQKVVKDSRTNRASSTESREEALMADVRRGGGPRIWSPKLELDGTPILWDTSLRNYDGGRAGYVAEALQQPLLLPHDMASFKRFTQQELFMSLKRDLAMVSAPFLSLGFTLH